MVPFMIGYTTYLKKEAKDGKDLEAYGRRDFGYSFRSFCLNLCSWACYRNYCQREMKSLMDVKITNIYNNDALPGKGLQSGHGQSFYIEYEKEKILFDIGWKGKRFLNNINHLGISPNQIKKIVFSHGHMDHTGGLPAFLKAKTVNEPIGIIAHPSVTEPKAVKIFGLRLLSASFPKLDKKLEERIKFNFVREPFKVTTKLSTTGEIRDRSEKDGTSKKIVHKVNGKWERDVLFDDLSLILETKDGLVLICGCCHAGLLNTCAYVAKLFNKNIIAILGGTHMLEFSKEEVEHVGDVLEKAYGSPMLYLNHCTGKKTISQLKARFGSEIVRPCLVGTELTFEC